MTLRRAEACSPSTWPGGGKLCNDQWAISPADRAPFGGCKLHALLAKFVGLQKACETCNKPGFK